ncbi:MAG: DegV family protein [Malacoplasma sp.]
MKPEKIAFIVDSSFSTSEEYLKKNHMYKVFFGITDSDGNDYLDDGKMITTKFIIDKLSEGQFFKTNAVVPGAVMVLLESLYEVYDKVICFAVSSGLSSYYNNILFLLNEPEYKDKLFIVDTKEVAYSAYDLIDTSRKMLDNGESIEKVIEYAKNYHLKSYSMFTCETWAALSKSGRVPKLLSTIFDKVGTRPLILFYEKNRLGGISRSFEGLVSKMISEYKRIFNYTGPKEIEHVVFYNNFLDDKKAQYIRNKIAQEFSVPINKIIETMSPNIVIVYTAKGSFGITIKSKNARK